MYSKAVFFLTLLFITTVCGASIETSSRQTTFVSRRECRSRPALICNISPVSGSSVSGVVTFRSVVRIIEGETRCVVRIRATVNGLTGRRHGFHIHEYGDISAGDGLSTGPHFGNPEGTPVAHGLPNDEVRHWGDFGNLRAVEGTATYSRIDTVITTPGIIGRGITVHEGRDQGADEQPTGASGARIGVCVIGIANPSSFA